VFAASVGFGIGLKPPIGTRVMLSTPAQTNASPASIWMAPAAMWIDCMDEPQKRLTVVPATDFGSPARKTTLRAMLKPCSPSGKAFPRMRSSMSAGSMPALPTRAFTTAATMSSGRTLVSAPLFAKWKGERA
jgi:hypothetical protein